VLLIETLYRIEEFCQKTENTNINCKILRFPSFAYTHDI
jgi:hypothetical protein